jgi:hypothetical protein
MALANAAKRTAMALADGQCANEEINAAFRVNAAVWTCRTALRDQAIDRIWRICANTAQRRLAAFVSARKRTTQICQRV